MDGCAGKMNKNYLLGFKIYLFIYFFSANVLAEDSVASLLQLMKSDSAVKTAYHETRTLELFDQPWQGSGYMYSLAPDLMIREQILPQRLLMGIKGNQMFYFDPENNIRHQGEMTEDNPLSLNIAVFKAFINADETLLRRMYLIELKSTEYRWVMTLKAKQQSQTDFSIVVSGLPNQQIDTLIIQQADGDLSEFMLKNESFQSKHLTQTVTRLYHELVGK